MELHKAGTDRHIQYMEVNTGLENEYPLAHVALTPRPYFARPTKVAFCQKEQITSLFTFGFPDSQCQPLCSPVDVGG